MHYVALATDYDGTVAHDGIIDEATTAALERLRHGGRKLILVTGRELGDLLRVQPRLELFDLIVAENGALLYTPATGEERTLAEPPPPRFAERLRERGVAPLSVGRVIVASWEPNEGTVLDTIRELGLELQIIFNKGAVMVLPAGINKESGLRAALELLEIAPISCVAVGDAENDFAFLDLCGTPVAVANAIPSLKERAALVTDGVRGAGVAELVERIVATDLAELDAANPRQQIALAEDDAPDAPPVGLTPHRANVLVVGGSGSGKSTLTAGLLERMIARGFSYCVIDPEGDYGESAGAVAVGTAHEAPQAEMIGQVLHKTGASVSVNLLGVGVSDRPAFLAGLLPDLLSWRTRTGRPHVIVIDEAHHVFPAGLSGPMLPAHPRGLMFITTRPDAVAQGVLELVDTVLAVGADAWADLAAVCAARGLAAPEGGTALERGEVLAMSVADAGVRRLRVIPGSTQQRRHVRKYAAGDLGEERSFYFRGADGRLNLRAKNLLVFLDLADGVDDDTWEFHRTRGDYSRWVGLAVKDEDLTRAIAAAEGEAGAPLESRRRVREAVEARYTLPG